MSFFGALFMGGTSPSQNEKAKLSILYYCSVSQANKVKERSTSWPGMFGVHALQRPPVRLKHLQFAAILCKLPNVCGGGRSKSMPQMAIVEKDLYSQK
jgi:hypothetical protein